MYCRTSPAYIEEISEIHRTEPYVYSQMIAGADAPDFGEAKNSWLTGTAAWTFLSVSQAILGVKPTLDGLKIDPCVPSSVRHYRVRRVYRGATYEIEVENPLGMECGVKAMFIDGVAHPGCVIPVQKPGSTVSVRVMLG